jgi:hypothetical protein
LRDEIKRRNEKMGNIERLKMKTMQHAKIIGFTSYSPLRPIEILFLVKNPNQVAQTTTSSTTLNIKAKEEEFVLVTEG